MGPEKKLLIVSYTPSENTLALTNKVAEGARNGLAAVELMAFGLEQEIF
jgi:hypothetical protein